MRGLSERDVQRLVREVCPCGGDRAHDPARDLECDWALRVVKSVAASRVLAERDAAIRDEAKAEALAPIRALADKWYPHGYLAAGPEVIRDLRALLDGGDQS